MLWMDYPCVGGFKLGEVFERMTVMEIYRNEKYAMRAIAMCSCGNIKDVSYYDLKNGRIKSCGCLKIESLIERNSSIERIKNKYFNKEEYVVGLITLPISLAGTEFFFDKSLYEIVYPYNWRINTSGYVVTTIKCKEESLHRLIMGFPDGLVDHIDRNKMNNLVENLRIINDRFSAINKNPTRANSSGVIGVNYDNGGWVARISSELGKRIFLGKFKDIDSAILARLEGEKKYYGEYAPQKHLYERYGIK